MITLDSADRSAIEARVKSLVRYFSVCKDMISLEKKYFGLRVPIEQAWCVYRAMESYPSGDLTIHNEEQFRSFVSGNSFPRDILSVYTRFICSLSNEDVSTLEHSSWKIVNPQSMSTWFNRSITAAVRNTIRNQVPMTVRPDLHNVVCAINRITAGNVGVIRQGSLAELINFIESHISNQNALCYNCGQQSVPTQVGTCGLCGWVQQISQQTKKRGI